MGPEAWRLALPKVWTKTLALLDPIDRQTYQTAKPPLFGRATWFEEATVERGGRGKEKGGFEGLLKKYLAGPLDFAD